MNKLGPKKLQVILSCAAGFCSECIVMIAQMILNQIIINIAALRNRLWNKKQIKGTYTKIAAERIQQGNNIYKQISCSTNRLIQNVGDVREWIDLTKFIFSQCMYNK